MKENEPTDRSDARADFERLTIEIVDPTKLDESEEPIQDIDTIQG